MAKITNFLLHIIFPQWKTRIKEKRIMWLLHESPFRGVGIHHPTTFIIIIQGIQLPPGYLLWKCRKWCSTHMIIPAWFSQTYSFSYSACLSDIFLYHSLPKGSSKNPHSHPNLLSPAPAPLPFTSFKSHFFTISGFWPIPAATPTVTPCPYLDNSALVSPPPVFCPHFPNPLSQPIHAARVPWTARSPNQSILKEISPE